MAENTATAAAFTVTKSTVELYKIRHASGCYWADITIDADGGKGRISIASDYGNWQNYWGAAGPDFKAFLASINQGYAATKFGAEPQIDVDKSLKEFRRMVADYRKDRTIDKEEARDIRAELDELRDESHQTIAQAIQHTDKLYAFLYRHAGEVDFTYEDNPHFARFWKELWPLLLAEFAKEAAGALTIEKGEAS
ncbi:MAG: hypothetical protein ACRYFZ_09655 [Janthinobacterium lividum]